MEMAPSPSLTGHINNEAGTAATNAERWYNLQQSADNVSFREFGRNTDDYTITRQQHSTVPEPVEHARSHMNGPTLVVEGE